MKSTQSRSIQTKHGEKPKSCGRMLERRRSAMIVGTEQGPWSGHRGKSGRSVELCEVVARLSDGSTRSAVAEVAYAPNERERILGPVLAGEGTENEVGAVQRLIFRRIAAIQKAVGELYRQYGLCDAQ